MRNLLFLEIFYNSNSVMVLQDVLESIWVYTSNYQEIKKRLEEFDPIYPTPYFPNNKFVLNLTEIMNVSFIYKIEMTLKLPKIFANARDDFDIKFDLVDQQRSCRRPLGANGMLFSGDEIVYRFKHHIDKVYSLEVR